MLKLKIISVGKTREAWLDEAIQEYAKRLSQLVSIEFVFAKDDEQLIQLVSKEPYAICLDPAGMQTTSERFSKELMRKFEEGGSRLVFVIGGPDGLPSALKNNYPLLSLSQLTMTHQIIRLVLIEQIYRAFEIDRGSKYHK